jgi:two-component system response regulator HydG
MPGGPDDLQAEQSTLLRPNTAPSRALGAWTLRVVDGADAGKTFSFDGAHPSRVLIGTSPACDVRLTDSEVSRRHAALEPGPTQLRLFDLGSTNGTLVGATRIVEALLRGGEVLHLGASALRVEVADNAQPVPISDAMSFGKMIGSSIEMRRLYPLCARLAASDVPVVIEGETGTGKEVLAEALHAASPRASGPFMVLDCTAVPASLLESELFGHERGAFTGATTARKGVFEQANGGTLLIDEIGDLALALQPKLLRAIQQSVVRRVGGDKWIPVDVRVLAATRRDLDRAVQAGLFRDDLFFRLAVARIELPPLRARQGDISVLAHRFWKELGGAGALPYDLLRRCEEYAWPGNVRELYNEIARRIALGDVNTETDASSSGAFAPAPPGAQAQAPDFMERVLAEDLPLPRARQRVVDEFQRRYVERVVAKHGGSIVRAAEASGIAHRYFQILRARQKR